MLATIRTGTALFTIATCLFSHPTSATCLDYADELRVTDTFSTGHSTYSTIVSDGYAYITRSLNTYEPYTSTAIYDLRDPSDIHGVASISAPVPPGWGPTAYSAVGVGFGRFCGIDQGWIYFRDVSDPSESVAIIDSLPVTNTGVRTAMGDGYCYLVTKAPDDVYTLEVIDIAGLGAPTYVASLELPGTVIGMIVHDVYLLIAGDVGGLTIVDVTNPLVPALTSTSPLAHAVRNVAADGDLVLVTGDGTFTIVDVSDIFNPSSRSSLEIVGAGSIAIRDDVAFVGSGAIAVIDIADPDAPILLDRLGYPDSALGHPGVWNDTLIGSGLVYGFGQPGGIGVAWLVTHPRPRAIVSSVAIGTGRGRVTVEGDYAYAADSGGLTVIDVSDPGAPLAITEMFDGERLEDIVVVGNHAYVAHEYGLYVLDVASPDSPEILGFADIGGTRGVVVRDHLAYVATTTGLAIVDVSSATKPVVIGTWNNGAARDLVIGGDVVFLIDSFLDEHLQVVDVSDPSAPVEITRIDIGDNPRDIAMVGSTLFVPAYDGVYPVDVSNPAGPIPKPSVGCHGRGLGMHAVGSVLYVATETGPIVLDITDPLAPECVGATIVSSRDVFATGSNVYVVDNDAFTVLEPQCQGATPIDPGTDSPGVTPLANNVLLAYPSPASSLATVRFLGSVTGKRTLQARVLNVGGRLVDEVKLIRSDVGFVGNWDARDAPPGVYFLHVRTREGVATQRVVRVE